MDNKQKNLPFNDWHGTPCYERRCISSKPKLTIEFVATKGLVVKFQIGQCFCPVWNLFVRVCPHNHKVQYGRERFVSGSPSVCNYLFVRQSHQGSQKCEHFRIYQSQRQILGEMFVSCFVRFSVCLELFVCPVHSVSHTRE